MIKSFAEFGRYRIELDESFAHGRTFNPDVKIWYEQVPIRRKGFIYLKSTNGCAAYVPTIGTINNMQKTLESAKIHHTVDKCDGEGLIYFDLHDFKKVAKILGAKRKRPAPSLEQIKKGCAALKLYRESKAQGRCTAPGSAIE